ncbi:MAG: sensor histidine kinase [Flavobacteriales bacterium]
MKQFALLTLFLICLQANCQDNSSQKLEDSLIGLLNQSFYQTEIVGDDKQTMSKLLQAQDLANKYPYLKKSYYKPMVSLIRALTLYNLNQLNESEKFAYDAYETSKQTNSHKIKQVSLNLLAALMAEKRKLQVSSTYLRLALKELDSITPTGLDKKLFSFNKDEQKIDLYHSLAEVEYNINLYWRFNLPQPNSDSLLKSSRKTIFYGKQALYYIKKTNKRLSRKKFLYIMLGISSLNLYQLDQTKRYLDSALTLIDTKTDYLNNFRVHYVYGNYYNKVANFEEAKNHYLKAYKNSRKYTDYIRKDFMSKLDSELNFLTKELQGSLLTTEIDLQKTQKTKNIVSILFAILLMASLILYSFFQRRLVKIQRKTNHKLREQNSILNKSIKKRNELEKKITDIQDLIGKDLHDNFGNRLAGINMSSVVLKDIIKNKDNSDIELTKFLKNLDHGISQLDSDIKDLIWANNSQNNSYSKLVDRVELFVNDYQQNANFTIQFSHVADQDYFFPKFWNRQILLIIKEATNNSVKHAKTTVVEIKITVLNNYLEVICKDQGIGFDIEKVSRYSGLTNMKRRATFIHCKLDIQSKINCGTTIKLIGEIIQ